MYEIEKDIPVKKLLKQWQKRADKCHKLGIHISNQVKSEALLAVSETYILCIDELNCHLIQQISEQGNLCKK